MGENLFDEALQTAWGQFEKHLENAMEQLDGVAMVIEVEAETTGDGSAPYVQFTENDAGIRAEVSSNVYLDEACRLTKVQKRSLKALGWHKPDGDHANWWVELEHGETGLLRSMTMGALRQALGVPHPEFLTRKVVEGGAADAADVFEHEFGFPDSREELSELLDATICHHLGEELAKDEDGDIPIDCGAVPVWLRVLEDAPVVRVFSYVAVDVVSGRQARIEADVLNRQHGLLKFTVVDRNVIATIDLPASPFVAQHVRDMVDLAARILNDVAEDLALRTGGRLFFSRGRAEHPKGR